MSKEMTLRDVCSVNVYMRNMADYDELNKIYVDTFSFANPPTRVCIQCPLPNDVGLILDAVSYAFYYGLAARPDFDRVSNVAEPSAYAIFV